MIRATVIVPKEVMFDPVRFNRAISTAMDAAAEGMRIDFQVTTQTWKGHPPFYIQADGFKRVVWTDSRIYLFVSRGTRIRYATMTGDFIAKTKVGRIASGPGRGGVAFISRAHPRPGIKARRFEEVIAKKWIKNFPDLIQRAVNTEALRASRGL